MTQDTSATCPLTSTVQDSSPVAGQLGR
ncbi:hypothetical protein, partial [Mycobacterium tuberculosis]